MRTQKHTRGYTLIELLVTIVIIAILLTLLLSVMRRGRETVKEIQCKNNQKEIGISFADYMIDHKNLYPAAINQSCKITWSDRLSAYDGRNFSNAEILSELRLSNKEAGRGAEMYQCENDTSRRKVGSAYKASYAMNVNVGKYDSSAHILDIKTPALTVALAEFTWNQVYLGFAPNKSNKGIGSYIRLARRQRAWGQANKYGLHGEDLFNYLFVDGHVQKRNLLEIEANHNLSLNVPVKDSSDSE